MRQRDANWLESLVKEHNTAIRRYCAARLPSSAVDDVVAEVFATAWQARDQVRDPALPWLIACARLRVLSDGRRRSRESELLERAYRQRRCSDGHEPDLWWIYQALAELTPEAREILALNAWDGLRPAQIAQVLGCTELAARSRLHRARRAAAKLLRGYESEFTLTTVSRERCMQS